MLYQTKNPHGGDIYGEEIRLDFSANTNPFGTPQGVLRAVQTALPEMHRYPDPYCRKLTRSISDYEGIPIESILCGSGAAELIYAYCEADCPKSAVELAPTFSEYALALRRVGCKVDRYRLRQEHQFALGEDFLDYLAETHPEVVFLCNPNNPTGQTIAPELLERILLFCAERGMRLFMDECFLDLSDAGESLKGLLAAHPQADTESVHQELRYGGHSPGLLSEFGFRPSGTDVPGGAALECIQPGPGCGSGGIGGAGFPAENQSPDRAGAAVAANRAGNTGVPGLPIPYKLPSVSGGPWAS